MTIAQGKAFAVDRHFGRRLPYAKRQLAVLCRLGLLPGDPLAQAVFPGRAGRQWVFDTALPFNLITVAATVNNLPLGIEQFAVDLQTLRLRSDQQRVDLPLRRRAELIQRRRRRSSTRIGVVKPGGTGAPLAQIDAKVTRAACGGTV